MTDYSDEGCDPTRAPIPVSPLGPVLAGRLRQVLATQDGTRLLAAELRLHGYLLLATEELEEVVTVFTSLLPEGEGLAVGEYREAVGWLERAVGGEESQ